MENRTLSQNPGKMSETRQRQGYLCFMRLLQEISYVWVMVEIIQIHKCTVGGQPGVSLLEKVSQIKQRKKAGKPRRFGMT